MIAVVGATALAGCTSLGSDDGLSDGTSVNLLLNWRPNGLHIPYYVAKDRGYYEDEGFADVSIESGNGADFSAEQAGLGNTELAVTSSEQLLNVNSRELSTRSVAVVMQRGQTVIYTAQELFGEELTEPAQLAGKTIGVAPGAVELMTDAYLTQLGLRDEIEWVETGFEGTQMLLNGEIDLHANVFSDAVGAEAQGYTVDMLDIAAKVESYGHLIAAADAFVENRPAAVEAFIRATARGCAWAIENPTEGVDSLIDSSPELAEIRDQHRRRWELMVDGYLLSDAVAEHGWGWSESEPWERTYEALDAGGMLGGEVDPAAVWTNEYLDTDSEHITGFEVVG